MRIRRKYWFVPALAVLGIILALLHFYSNQPKPGDELRLDPTLPAEPLPPAAPKADEQSAPTPAEPAPNAAPPTSNTHSKIPTPEQLREAEKIRSEIKVSLAALYGSQKSFYSEYHRYTTDFNSLGYAPEGNNFKYNSGFVSAFHPGTKDVANEDPRIMSTEEMVTTYSNRNSITTLANAHLADYAKYCQMGCTATKDHFEIISVANLDDDPDLEVWILNDKKELTQVNNDLAN